MTEKIFNKLEYKTHLNLKKVESNKRSSVKKGSQSLKDVADILHGDAYLRLIGKKDCIIKTIENIEIYQNKIQDKIFSDRVFVFNDLVSKSLNREGVVSYLSEVLNKKIVINICEKEIDLKNIDYSIYDEEVYNAEKEFDFYKKERKIKLKELSIIKRNMKNLHHYTSFLKKYRLKTPVLNTSEFKIGNKNKNIFLDFINFISPITSKNLFYKVTRKYDKYNKKNKDEKRDFLKDEIRYQMFFMEQNKIKEDLKKITKKANYWKDKIDKTIKYKEEILMLKDDKILYKHLKKIFSLNFNNEDLIEYLHTYYKDENTKFNLSNDIAISNLFANIIESLEEDLCKIEYVSNDLNSFTRQIRLEQYRRRNKMLNIDFSNLNNELDEFFIQVQEKINFFNENKDLLLKAEINRKFNSWEDSYSFILSKFLENHQYFKGVIYIYKDKLGEDLINSILQSFDKQYVEINFDSLISIIKEINLILKA